MDPSFWFGRWREGRIAFHEGRPNKYLLRDAGRLAGRVLVPLCGKTEDLAHLASLGHEVVGVELVEDAVRQFFVEHQVEARVTPRGPFIEHRAGGIAILAGDFFATTSELLGSVQSIYDRAALIALPPATRPAYVAHLRKLVARGTPALVVTYESAPGSVEGPPFSLLEPELRALFAGSDVELIDEGPDERIRPGAAAVERCFIIKL